MKRIIALLLAAMMVFCLCACGGDAPADSDNDSGKASTKTENTDVSIEEQILYDANDIKITATGLDDSWYGTELKLLIENNSSQDITVQARNANVNGYMVTTSMSADVAAGKKANDSLTFETTSLKDCGIETMATMEFYFVIIDSESFEDIYNTDVITINTSVAEGYTQTYDDSGEVLAEVNGIKIVSKGLSEKDSFWGPGLIVYIENNSDQDITVQARDVSINGFMVDPSMSEDVVAGKRAITAVQFFDSDLEDNGIETINDLELYFTIFNLESWNEIANTDVINLSF